MLRPAFYFLRAEAKWPKVPTAMDVCAKTVRRYLAKGRSWLAMPRPFRAIAPRGVFRFPPSCPVKLGEIEAKSSIFPTSKDARLCAAILDLRDNPPAPPVWNAVNISASPAIATTNGRTIERR